MNEDKILAFKVFCLESYKAAHNLTGSAAYETFSKYKVFDYLASCYDVLHYTGKLYLVNDIDEFIEQNN